MPLNLSILVRDTDHYMLVIRFEWVYMQNNLCLLLHLFPDTSRYISLHQFRNLPMERNMFLLNMPLILKAVYLLFLHVYFHILHLFLSPEMQNSHRRMFLHLPQDNFVSIVEGGREKQSLLLFLEHRDDFMPLNLRMSLYHKQGYIFH